MPRFFNPYIIVAQLTVGFVLCISPISVAEQFPEITNSEKAAFGALPPEETASTARVPDGFKLQLFAGEPDVQNPIAMTFDERGRLWVAENYSWAGSDFGGFTRDHKDRIVIFEDTNGDGRFDKRTVFTDQVNKLTSIEIGNGGVWAICLPHVIFIPDRDRDDVPDGPAEVVFDGIDEGPVGHTPANGLKLGPDGWMYARHGILATSSIGIPGATASQRVNINTGVWRFHPITREVQTVIHGMTNSWGFDFDQHGEMFVINTVIGHLWHVVPGAHVERMFGVDINPNSYQLIEQTADHVHWDTGEIWHEIRDGMSDKTDAAGGGHAHIGLMIYQGDNWPDEYRDRIYTLNLHGRRINSDSLERQGTAYVAKHGPDMCFIQDTWFRGMELLTGPDGAVYFSDWSDTGECHDHDGVHRTSGRIYKLSYEPSYAPQTGIDLLKYSDAELFALLAHKNTWWARQARRILTERCLLDANATTRAFLASNLNVLHSSDLSVPARLRCLETFYTCEVIPEAQLIELLADSDEFVQSAALRLLTDKLTPELPPSEDLFGALVGLAETKGAGLIDLYLASALQKLPISHRVRIAAPLTLKAQWGDDRSFPKMLWYGIEPIAATDEATAILLAKNSLIPLVTENIVRRITQDLEHRSGAVEMLLKTASENNFVLKGAVVRGMAKALDGWQKAPQPAAWDAFQGVLNEEVLAEVSQEMHSLRLVFGDGKAVDELMAMIGDAEVDGDARRQALRSLAMSRPHDFATKLFGLLDDRVLGPEAIKNLSYFDHPDTPAHLLHRWAHLGPEQRKDIVNTLSARPTYASALLSALRDGRVSASDISAFHARQMHSFEDDSLSREIHELWGDVNSTTEEKKALMEDWKEKLKPETIAEADLSAGRYLFQQNCANCHVLYGVGSKIGPDITGSNRNNLDYLLENILDPSASVGAEFRTVIVLLEDDRVVNGVVVEQTDRTLTLQTAQDRQTIDRNEIDSMKQSTTSLMPDGIIQNMTQEQVRDLIGYLMHHAQVPLPE